MNNSSNIPKNIILSPPTLTTLMKKDFIKNFLFYKMFVSKIFQK